jgi:RNA polymerase sigma factor (sigma-70 family)
MAPRETTAGRQLAPPRDQRERFFLDNLALIRRVAASVARRRRLSADETEEFVSDVLFRLIRNDYAILSKFRGQSSLATFLRPVIDRICLDRRIAHWGKWRPSVHSQRLGEVAVALERLTRREGLSFDEACATLEINRRVRIDRKTLEAIPTSRRDGGPRRPVSDEVLANMAGPEAPPDDAVFAAEERRVLDNAARSLTALVRALPSHDRHLLQLFYGRGHSVATIARMLSANQKALYRRFAELRSHLRAGLEAVGVDARTIVPLLGRRHVVAAGVFDVPRAQPSLEPADEAAFSALPSLAEAVAFAHLSGTGTTGTATDFASTCE